MVSTRKKRQSNRKVLSQINGFDQVIVFGNAMSNRQENTTVNEGTADQEFTAGNSGGGPALNENVVNVKILERCFNGRIDREIGKIVGTVEDRIQSTILSAIDSIITPKIKLAIRSKNASSERDATSVMASSEREENIRVTASFVNLSEKNNTLHVLNTNDETRNKNPDEVSEFSNPDTHFDPQPHTHHTDVIAEAEKLATEDSEPTKSD